MTDPILIAADHGGYALKEAIKAALPQHDWIDLGTDTEDRPSDSPDFGCAVARAIEQGRAERGILICGTGIGISIAANRSPAVRCALATNTTMARLARAHNDANVLALGARIIALELALEIVEAFLATPFDGGRHAARVAKLGAPCA
jgi:ribose 5-phosphate isomerase B